MAVEYQQYDWQVVDYQGFCLDERILDRTTGRPLQIRGPKPTRLEPGKYFVCLGAAQTFGRFCQRPFPTILQDQLEMPVLNISHGGAGPRFWCGDNAHLLKYLNNARFVALQVMSGRSSSCSLFESDGVGFYRRKSDGAEMSSDAALGVIIQSGDTQLLTRVVDEMQQDWYDSYADLISRIKVPTILLWFASRRQRYTPTFDSLRGMLGAFPHLVNADMVAKVRGLCDGYVECTTKRGLPQLLIDRFNGRPAVVEDPWTSKPWVNNWYYPSFEMHEDAAQALAPICAVHCGLR
jgi:Domain of unknown function (DUF6473)